MVWTLSYWFQDNIFSLELLSKVFRNAYKPQNQIPVLNFRKD